MLVFWCFILCEICKSIVGDCPNLHEGDSSKCTGCPPTYKGLPCASTTHYHGLGGSCGCSETTVKYLPKYTAAISEDYIAHNLVTGKLWCGRRCGECFELTTTGGHPWEKHDGLHEGQKVTVLITNSCPRKSGHGGICNMTKDPISCERDGDCWRYNNMWGYLAHFDLRNDLGQYEQLGWYDINPEVTYERVHCSQEMKMRWEHHCQCYKKAEHPSQDFPFDDWRYHNTTHEG